MSISTTTNRVVNAGNGSSTVFPFPYEFFQDSDLEVYLYQSSVVATQVLNVNYTVSGTKNAQGVYPTGASVITTCAVPISSLLVVTRSPLRVQNYSLPQGGTINSGALTNQLDYLTLLIQRLEDKAERSVKLRDGYGDPFDAILPPNIGGSPNSLLVVNPTGTGWVMGSSAPGASGPTIPTSTVTGQTLLAQASGTPVWSSGVSMRYTTTGNVIGNTDTIINFGTKDFETSSSYVVATGTFTCPIEGRYSVEATGNFANSTYNPTAVVFLTTYVNSSVHSVGPKLNTGVTTAAVGVQMRTVVNCSSGWKIQVAGQNTRTGVTLLTGNATDSYLAINWIGPKA